ncbi:MAG: DUF1972 domain-containing protein [Cyclobacteriaceae bacterium]|nr:DUF1972 domain-containing protein [Cyclobacteriaceae bacterium]
MKIGIIGTRGIPNHYGGFEQFAEYLSYYLAHQGHEVEVYNSHNHPYKSKVWNKVRLVHQFDPEYLLGTAGQFIYDLNCIWHTRKAGYDIILQLGYTSSSIWSFLFPKSSVVITNMDGLEWQRAKYGRFIKRFLRLAERLGVNGSDVLVADSIGIQQYLKEKYNVHSHFIPYGANLFTDPDESIIDKFQVSSFQYNLLIARMEPENNIEVILDGVVESGVKNPFLVIGSTGNRFGTKLVLKYKEYSFIRFMGPLYDIIQLNNLRYFSNIYFHGHSVGGTNPSLLEAMASNSLICANENVFNLAILEKDAYYFKTAIDVARVLKSVQKDGNEMKKMFNNIDKINSTYNWSKVNSQYQELFLSSIRK